MQGVEQPVHPRIDLAATVRAPLISPQAGESRIG
jgi:hypothetical protein